MILPYLLLSLLPCTRATSELSSKRGISFHHDTHLGDNQLLLTNQTKISWYYTWSLYPSQVYQSTNSSVAFVPLIHGLGDASSPSLSSTINRLPPSSKHLLSFNEPDGTVDSGGSSISPEDAAASYIKYIVPLRSGNDTEARKWKISHPSVTGSPRGLEWLKKFVQACAALDKNGCPLDFIAVHWYGDFVGLSSWLDTVHDYYNKTMYPAPVPKFWITEMALPQASPENTLSMLSSALPYLDGLDYVDAYAWFGSFRRNEANAWTGTAVSMFDERGGLTDVGAMYLGGKDNGYTPGMRGVPTDAGFRVGAIWNAMVALAVTLAMLVY